MASTTAVSGSVDPVHSTENGGAPVDDTSKKLKEGSDEEKSTTTTEDSVQDKSKARGVKAVVDLASLERWHTTTPTLRPKDDGEDEDPEVDPEDSSSSASSASLTTSSASSTTTSASSTTTSASSTTTSASSTPPKPLPQKVLPEDDPMAFLHNIDFTLAKERLEKEKAEAEQKRLEKEEKEKALFPVSHDLNKKIILWQGDLLSLDIDCIVNTTNERLTDKSGISGRVFHYGGSELTSECISSEGCPTGDAIITKGYSLLARHVIHTVGPRFSVKYQTAAENALHGCYRRSLEVLKDHKLTQIAFPVVNTDRKGYPKKPAAHVAIRTIRRFLERWGDNLETIVLVMENSSDYQIYLNTLPLYFPRDQLEEKAAVKLLPKEIGNELGEKVIEERKIKITPFLSPPKPIDEELDEKKMNTDDMRVTSIDAPNDLGAFHEMQDNPDDLRRKQELTRPKAELEKEANERRYAGYLRRAQEEDLRDMQALNFVYQSGFDQLGRPIIVFVISQLPADSPRNLERVLLYMIKLLDPLVTQDYNVIYFHSAIQNNNKPPFNWLKEVYGIFNRKYKKNMKRLFIVHPNFWVKLVLWFAQPFVKKKFWRKVQYVQRLFDLYEFFDPKTLLIPEPIRRYDLDLFGAEYASSSDFKEKSKNENDQL